MADDYDDEDDRDEAAEGGSRADHAAVASFVLTMLHAATVAHVMHLKARRYAEHEALGGLYEGLPGLVDRYAETYQGRYGLMTAYPSGFRMPTGSATAEIAALDGYLADVREELPEDEDLCNIFDEITALVASTLYKLRFLK